MIFPNKQSSLVLSENISLASLIKFEIRLPKGEDLYRGMMLADPDLSDGKYQQRYYKYDAETIFDPAKLNCFLKNQSQIIRAKGHVLTNNGWILLNFTLSGCSYEPCEEKKFSEIVIVSDEKTAYDQSFNPGILSAIVCN
jgi:G3E family GTPase